MYIKLNYKNTANIIYKFIKNSNLKKVVDYGKGFTNIILMNLIMLNLDSLF